MYGVLLMVPFCTRGEKKQRIIVDFSKTSRAGKVFFFHQWRKKVKINAILHTEIKNFYFARKSKKSWKSHWNKRHCDITLMTFFHVAYKEAQNNVWHLFILDGFKKQRVYILINSMFETWSSCPFWLVNFWKV